ncbi:MAG: hypothetical protein COV45_03505 [Deltaproteobacteria bacterium CG11_big_fil_rev_8_21_14_0_20_47_16]|nr:MAG: hypothetical protein COV45_03505 [Deltaproteobacteria bacterium CG11_big_fil_rev_8_21_14_0_20_47_16]
MSALTTDVGLTYVRNHHTYNAFEDALQNRGYFSRLLDVPVCLTVRDEHRAKVVIGDDCDSGSDHFLGHVSDYQYNLFKAEVLKGNIPLVALSRQKRSEFLNYSEYPIEAPAIGGVAGALAGGIVFSSTGPFLLVAAAGCALGGVVGAIIQ